jgi:hypothetical protein
VLHTFCFENLICSSSYECALLSVVSFTFPLPSEDVPCVSQNGEFSLRVRGIIDNDRISLMTKIKHHVGLKPSPRTFSPLVPVPNYSITGQTFRCLKFATTKRKKTNTFKPGNQYRQHSNNVLKVMYLLSLFICVVNYCLLLMNLVCNLHFLLYSMKQNVRHITNMNLTLLSILRFHSFLHHVYERNI